MMTKKITLLIICSLFAACVRQSKSEVMTRADFIKTFVHKVGFIKLPYSHNLNLDKEDCKYLIDIKSIDSLFFDNYDNQIIGVLPDTSNYYGILYYKVGDDLYPSLRIFSHNGKKIDDKEICFGYCAGCGCECDSCSDVTTINKDLKISMRHFLKETECDSAGNKITSTTKCHVYSKDGQIKTNGLIFLSKVREIGCK